MVSLTPNIAKPIHHFTLAPGSRVTIADVTPNEFDEILNELGDQRLLRLTYYRGKLELRMPSEEHEVITRLIDAMISILCEEMELNLKTMGSTMLKSQQGSPEADNEYYIQNEPLVRSKTVDLAQDPPPDLMVEADVTHSDINKKEMYQKMGVAEFWSYDSKRGQLIFYILQANQQYQEQSTSATFPILQQNTLKDLCDRTRQTGELPAKRWFRQWVQQQLK